MTDEQKQECNLGQRIRRLARRDNLIATKSRKTHLWYFADERNNLQSPEQGLDELEALAYLTEERGAE